jgi:putative redox protein
MKVTLDLDRNMRLIGRNSAGLETVFDSHPVAGGEETAATPMEIMLESLCGCSFMDVLAILRKKRKTVTAMQVRAEAERSESHPKVFTKVHLVYDLTSPDAELADLQRAVDLSQQTYCGVSAMFKRSGCEVTWELMLKRA